MSTLPPLLPDLAKMCGLVGIVNASRPASAEALGRGVAALRHRGPDGAGVWASRDGRAALGHARLGVISPEDGAQPLVSRDAGLAAVVNGELYGHDGIREELETRGHVFQTGSDSEILVHLYQEEGIECVHKLRGEFAFLIWDEARRMMFAGRDRFGIKPLLWARTGHGFMFASEMKALAAMGRPARWDEEAFWQAASLQSVPQDRTLFQGVRQVRPGSVMVVADGEASEVSYWDLDFPTGPTGFKGLTEADLVRRFASLLEESVELRLRADVPVCAQLSSGIASRAVLGLMEKIAGGPVDCFAVSSGTPQTAGSCGSRLTLVKAGPRDLLERLPRAVREAEGLALDGRLARRHLLNEAVHAAGFKVALTGVGADDALGIPDAGEGWAGESGDAALAEGPSLAAAEEILGFVPAWLQKRAALGGRLRAALREEVAEDFKDRDPCRDMLAAVDRRQLQGRSRADQSSYVWVKAFLGGHILKDRDGAEMAWSVEGRPPFLDHHLFAFARALPAEMKALEGGTARVLRAAARPLVGDCASAPRRQPPLTALEDDPKTRQVVVDVVRSEAMRRTPFDSQKIATLVDGTDRMTPDQRAAAEPVVMAALSAAFLADAYMS